MNTLKLVEDFLCFEKENNLFECEVYGIKIWGFVRHMYYTALKTYKSGIEIPLQSNFKKRPIGALYNSIKFCRLFTSQPDVDVLFMSHPRRVKQYDGKYYCLYTDYLNEIIQKKYKTCFIEEPYWHEYIGTKDAHYTPTPSNNIFYVDKYEMWYLIKKFIFCRFFHKKYKVLKEVLTQINDKFTRKFCISLNSFEDLILDWALYPILMLKIYGKLLEKLSPKVIIAFYSPSPFRNTLVYSANIKKIPVIEMQHGTYMTENLFYKFYEPGKYTPLPDYVFTFSDKLFDKRLFAFKEKNKHIIPTGYIFLDSKVREYKNIQKAQDKKYILIISQGSLNEELRHFTRKLADLIKGKDAWHILYKKHPYEKDADYSDLKHKKITTIGNNEHDICYYLAKAYCQVGAYSTALYEGICFKLPTFIISNLYCADDVCNLLQGEKGVYTVESAAQVYDILFNKTVKKPNKNLINKLWFPVNHERIIKTVTKIIKNNQ